MKETILCLIGLCLSSPQPAREISSFPQDEVIVKPTFWEPSSEPNTFIDLLNKKILIINGEFREEKNLEVNLVWSKDGLYLGKLNQDQYPSFLLKLTNEGKDTAHNIKVSQPSKDFNLRFDNCSGRNLRFKESCSVRIGINGKGKDFKKFETELMAESMEKTKSAYVPVKAEVVDPYILSTLENLNNDEIKLSIKKPNDTILVVNRGEGIVDNLITRSLSSDIKIIKDNCASAILAINQYCSIIVGINSSARNLRTSYIRIEDIKRRATTEIKVLIEEEAKPIILTEKDLPKELPPKIVEKSEVPELEKTKVSIQLEEEKVETTSVEIEVKEVAKPSISTRSNLDVSVYMGLDNYNIKNLKPLPVVQDFYSLALKNLKLKEGEIISQEVAIEVVSNVQKAIDASDTSREVEVLMDNTGDDCKVHGLMATLKCKTKKMFLSIKDMDDNPVFIKNENGESERITVNKHKIYQIHKDLSPAETESDSVIFNEEMYLSANLDGKNKIFSIKDKDISIVSNTNEFGADNAYNLITFNGEVYYSALNSKGFIKLFKTNGKTITQLSDFYPFGNDYFSPVIIFNNELYFEGINPDGYLKLFKVARGGKTLIQVSDTNPNGNDAPRHFKVYNSELYFKAQNMKDNSKLFKINKEGIYQVSNISENDDNPEYLSVFNNVLYFSAYKEGEGSRLFFTDGRVVSLATRINKTSDDISDLFPFKDHLYFIALKEGVRKLFRTDGHKVEQFSNLRNKYSDFAVDYKEKRAGFTVFKEELYFIAKNKNNAFKIFKTNGKDIVQVSNLNEPHKELNPTGSDFPFNLMVYKDSLFFSAYSNTEGLKLFKIEKD